MNKEIRTTEIIIKRTDVVYFDMDGVLVENESDQEMWRKNRLKKGYFLNKKPMPSAREVFELFNSNCQVYLLSTPVWDNIHCFSEKREWVENYLGDSAKKKLILSHNKGLNKGALLIDDSKEHGVSEFEGIHIHFGQYPFLTWNDVLDRIKFINNLI